MKALVGAFNQEKALAGAFSVIVQPVVEPMDRFTALLINLSRCEGSARIFGVGISAFDPSLPGITNRTEDCTLETIGKPVFKR